MEDGSPNGGPSCFVFYGFRVGFRVRVKVGFRVRVGVRAEMFNLNNFLNGVAD